MNENRLRGYIPYFLWNGTRHNYKHIKYGRFNFISSMKESQEINCIKYQKDLI